MFSFREFESHHKLIAIRFIGIDLDFTKLFSVDKDLPLRGLSLRTALLAFERIGDLKSILSPSIQTAFGPNSLLDVGFHESSRLPSSTIAKVPGINLDGLWLPGIQRQSRRGDLFCRVQILFHQKR